MDVLRNEAPVAQAVDMPDVATNSEFVAFIRPLKERFALYDRTSPPARQPKNDATDPAKALPQGFIDAMSVREEVFVKEQSIPLENELDFDDKRCFHWVAFASVPGHHQPIHEVSHPYRRTSTSTKLPIGTIRLVPPPNTAIHHFNKHRKLDGTPYSGPVKSSKHNGTEPFIKLGRLCLLKDYRKVGVSTLLVNSAIEYARAWPSEISEMPSPGLAQEIKAELGDDVDTINVEWTGLILVHAQVGLQKFWAKHGFQLDEGMGMWDEEGIDHVGMWRRVELMKGRGGGDGTGVLRDYSVIKEKGINYPFGSK